MPEEDFDVIVAGGGPGGATLSAFVAMQGHRVLLLERERFPRYQIGESLLPSTVHGICAMLGVADEMREAGFTRKNGGCFRWGTSPDIWAFNFNTAPGLGDCHGYAYQVERSKFDRILLDNAMRKGVEVRQEARVHDVIRTNGRVEGVEYDDAAGVRHEVRARFVADASGNTSRLYQHAGERVFSRYFQNVALFCYFENGKRLPPPNEGNILCAAFDRGWFWYIPLSPTLTSVGAVVAKEEATEIVARGHEEAMEDFIARCPTIQDYLAHARRITDGIYGQFRVRKDYSYCNAKFWTPGLVLVGDAACFVDPVFSSGVHLATYGALLAARSINTALARDLDEAACFTEFENRYRREFANFYEFLLYFYDMHHDEESYFWQARKILHTEERANEAFVRLIAGASSAEEFFRDREGVGARMQAASDAAPDPQQKADRGTHWDVEDFVPGFHAEKRQVTSQAMFGLQRSAEAPMFDGGLVPSRDGFHWARAH